jgi:hypothetical protein
MKAPSIVMEMAKKSAVTSGQAPNELQALGFELRANHPSGLLGAGRSLCNFRPATAGSVFRASTRAQVAHIVSGMEDGTRRRVLSIGQLSIDLLDLLLNPSDATDFDLAVLIDEKQGWNAG